VYRQHNDHGTQNNNKIHKTTTMSRGTVSPHDATLWLPPSPAGAEARTSCTARTNLNSKLLQHYNKRTSQQQQQQQQQQRARKSSICFSTQQSS
jgi:hypothetical protein